MRRLSESFLRDLKPEGMLASLTEAVRRDVDLLLEIRDNYINIYFKGHSVLRLAQVRTVYSLTIDPEFVVPEVEGLRTLASDADVAHFVHALPLIKERVLGYCARGRASEIEWEQLLIRANNDEPKLNTEYFIVDRQIVPSSGAGRFDLLAIYWQREGRRQHQTVPLVLMELKFGLNPDIGRLAEQLGRYYTALPDHIEAEAKEAQLLLQQKIELGLIRQPKDRLAALSTLTVSPLKEKMRFAIVLIDYNPDSGLFPEPGLRALPFADRIDVFHTGFGLWWKRSVRLGNPEVQG